MRSWTFRVGAWIAVAAAYFLAAKLGLHLAVVNPSATAVWPPTGLAIAAVLLLGNGSAAGVFVGAFLANATTQGTIPTSLGIALGNTLEALVGAYLVRRFANGTAAFDRASDFLRFALLAGVVSTTVSASIGVAVLWAGGFVAPGTGSATWLTWWLGDAAGAMLVTPVVVLWWREPRLAWRRSKAVEAGLLVVTLTALALWIFGPTYTATALDFPFAFLAAPVLLWVANRFGPKEAATGAALVSAIAVAGTARGHGPFAGAFMDSLLALQVFMAGLGTLALGIAAVVNERALAQRELQRARDDLDARVRERTAELTERNETLRQANESLDAFAFVVGHDLKEPARAADVLLGTLEREHATGLPAEGRELLREAREANRRLARLIVGLLEFARATRADLTLRKPIGVADALRDPSCTSRYATLLAERGGRLDPPDPTVRVAATPESLHQVLGNLVLNAIAHNPRPRPHVRVRAAPAQDPAWVEVVVEDDGPGFPDRVLASFAARGGATPGGGFGLIIARRAIERLHGRMWVGKSAEGGGAVHFTLPAAPSS